MRKIGQVFKKEWIFLYPIWLLCSSAVLIFESNWENSEGSYLTRRPLTKIVLLQVFVVSFCEAILFLTLWVLDLHFGSSNSKLGHIPFC